MYYELITKVTDESKELTDLIPSNDPSLKEHDGIKVQVTHTNYDQDNNKTAEKTLHFIEPEWVTDLSSFEEPRLPLPSPIPVYIDNEEDGNELAVAYESPFFIICTELISVLENAGIKGDFTTHPVEIRDPSANRVHRNYVTFKPTQRFIHAIDEEESSVMDIIDGTIFYSHITIDPNKVDEYDLFLHAIRKGSSYSLVISEKIKRIFESFASNCFIFSPLFIEDDDQYDESEDDWGDLN